MWHLLLAVSLGLAGCSGVQSPAPVLPNFPTDVESVAGDVTGSPTMGVVVLDAGFEGLQCAESRLVLARSAGAQLLSARQIVLPTTYADRTAVAAVELGPGTYHLVHYTCRNGANVTFAGAPLERARLPWAGKSWGASLASFAVGPSEVVNIGRLSLKRTGGGLIDLGGKKKGKKGFATPAVAALAPEAVARLHAERPELAQQMQAQPMALSASSDVRVERCHLVGEPAQPGQTAGSGKKKQNGNANAGFGIVSTSFSGPSAPMTDCVGEGGKSDQFKALVGSVGADASEGASGQ